MSKRSLLAVALFACLSSCAEDPVCPPEQPEDPGTPSGATCDGSSLTYENFGQGFMTNYCNNCHSSALKTEEERQCAPSDHNFDSLDDVLLNSEHIDGHAAAGPNSVNNEMPPSGNKMPTDQERMDLGTWLACEEERMPGP